MCTKTPIGSGLENAGWSPKGQVFRTQGILEQRVLLGGRSCCIVLTLGRTLMFCVFLKTELKAVDHVWNCGGRASETGLARGACP